LDKGANRVSHDRMIDALNKFTSNRNIELPDDGTPLPQHQRRPSSSSSSTVRPRFLLTPTLLMLLL
jgi:hypothetical protein